MEEVHLSIKRTARYYLIADESAPITEVWLVAHGYGQLAQYFIRHFKCLLHPGVLIIAPEALSRFYLDGTSGRIGASWMTREDRIYEINDYVNYLTQAYQHVCKDKNIQTHRLMVVGFSQGVPTVCRWIAETSFSVHALICWAGFFPHDMHWNADLKRRFLFPVYMIYGNEDPYIGKDSLNKIHDFKEKLHLKTLDRVFSGGHTLHEATLMEVAYELRNI
ncbi:MAG: dienelactone hydrolase family protein [Flavobacteriales bacterium]|nr:dienelactone hydrolase family protein [Flavobacteriales bacterium]